MNNSSAAQPLSVLLPLLSGIVYVLAALLLKRAGELGAGTWRTTAACNFATALLFTPFVFLGGDIPSWTPIWQPALVGLLFVAGQFFAVFSLKIGDVSVATPVLGIKIIIVALLTTLLLGETVEPSLWAAAVLSSAALALLNVTRGAHHTRVGATILMAGLAASSFALFDVLVQKWSPVWGMGRFLPLMMLCVALYSAPMFWVGSAQKPAADSNPRPWMIGGALALGFQGATFITSIAMFGGVTMANVLYSSRGLWSVVAVWVIGHWFSSREQHLGPRILAWRLSGATLMMIAIVLALTS